MNVVFSLAVACLFGTGAYLLLSRDLVRVVIGMVVISQAAVLTLMVSATTRGVAAIYPLAQGTLSDPLSQAMALTAIVIGTAVTALLLVLVLRVAQVYRSAALDELAASEGERDARLERSHGRSQQDEEGGAR